MDDLSALADDSCQVTKFAQAVDEYNSLTGQVVNTAKSKVLVNGAFKKKCADRLPFEMVDSAVSLGIRLQTGRVGRRVHETDIATRIVRRCSRISMLPLPAEVRDLLLAMAGASIATHAAWMLQFTKAQVSNIRRAILTALAVTGHFHGCAISWSLLGSCLSRHDAVAVGCSQTVPVVS